MGHKDKLITYNAEVQDMSFNNEKSFDQLKSFLEEVVRYYDSIIPDNGGRYQEDIKIRHYEQERMHMTLDLKILSNVSWKAGLSQKKKAYEECLKETKYDLKNALVHW
ncbi:hypothetical protein [Mucilaginibacter pedocola]|uniref:Uncharacterized protein n=1 Tax=Mucilaginibacter pedocola TaxID=1792845 RepID=A0A1S9PBX4_9SPHI|nr:hypothetical protein [Mucilaginibacter pedocola]OOQ58486.1 hypothetical protein BC343_07395 [Mucilaginibacter pedocola]